MTDTQMTDERLEQRWVPVTDEAGRTHMEAVWITVGVPATAATASAA
jgi:hypothetical protein